MYYKYVSTLHVEPKDWNSLFEFISYTNTESKVIAFTQALERKGE